VYYLSRTKNFYSYLTMLFVVITYAVFAYTADVRDEFFSTAPFSRYQYLTESFLKNHANLLIPVPPEYLKISNPYDFKQFRSIKLADGTYFKNRLCDVSFYKEKFYLYFGPLPVIFFYIPFKLITGLYPPAPLAVFFFLSLGFCIQYLLLLRIKEDFFKDISESHMVLAGFIMGYAWPLLFTIAIANYLETPISAAYCLMNMALFYLYKIFKNHFQNRDLFIFSMCLSLSVAGRPYFALIFLFLCPWLLYKIYRNKDRIMISSLCVIFPAVFIGSLLAVYNYARFDSIFEFGQRYQLLGGDDHGLYQGLFQLKNMMSNIVLGFYNYFIRPVSVNSLIPYIAMFYEAKIAKNYYFYDDSAGLFLTNPFILFVLLFPFMIRFYFKNKKYLSLRPLLWFLIFLSFISLIIIGFILSINFGSRRYVIDFSPYLIMLSIITVWLSKNYLSSQIFKILNLFYVITGILSIYIGFWIGAFTKPLYNTTLNFYFLAHRISIDLNYVVFYSLLIILLFAIVPKGLAFLRSRFQNGNQLPTPK